MTTAPVILDVRRPEEFAEGHVQGAVHINFQAPDFLDKVGQLDRQTPYVVYCHGGTRAGHAVEAMEKMGFTDVKNIGGYVAAAETLGLPLVTR
ncbi:rhodanese-like domain-containing protein [Schaalia sp. 19OD2882]|uniref:rhodanese-like domain-containing protein n=1 Tax=Schaalia sp. 19OD2882 TaxID=2794089 RepID=UPI001C1EE3B1|nr:rhodanese-like domain-containing protein [Schaalia sp. 19OD2882]QWW18881.1 rhodanese-like domain-containing protein [Schaalia sp. 19OD2882]